MKKLGVMVCGHGSRDADAIREFEAVARGIRQRLPHYDVDSGFLEFAVPVIRDGLDALRERGASDILAIPGMLFAAGHAKNDIPSVLNSYQKQHPEISIRYGRELAVDVKLLRAAAARTSAESGRLLRWALAFQHWWTRPVLRRRRGVHLGSRRLGH